MKAFQKYNSFDEDLWLQTGKKCELAGYGKTWLNLSRSPHKPPHIAKVTDNKNWNITDKQIGSAA